MFSVLILTKNEENDLPACLDSIKWCDDIHVFDSFSTDNTLKIAKTRGVNFYQYKFIGYATQRNTALATLQFKYQWVFLLDADERLPLNLNDKLKSILEQTDSSINAFRLRRKDYMYGKWLKYSQLSPFFVRLVRIGKVRYHREINEILEVEGKIVDLNEYFIHFPFSKGLSHWINKHNVYSSMEAIRFIEEQRNKLPFSLRQALFNKDFSLRRYHQKGLYYKVPLRPLVKWFYMVFIKMSILDGSRGILYSTLQSIYEFLIVAKVREIRKK
jgi:glycosyltransferase involved in cell wall biosynthesis